MDISLNWLRSLAPTLSDSVMTVAERITDAAVAVDEVVWLGAGLDELVVGQVQEISSHANADRLVICQVDIGRGEPAQVVTGAPVVEEGAFYPFVGVGQTLPGGQQIKRVKIRGAFSEGMLCSERELGLGRDQSGIMRLQGEFAPGQPLIEALGLNDHRLVLDVTANRPDLLGHWGVAREAAPGGDRDLVLPQFPEGRTIDFVVTEAPEEATAASVTVRIEDAEGCPRYMGAVVHGVEVGPSPEWLTRRLRAAGAQPINNVVDATNYVLLELNQPLHAFDLNTLGGHEVVIRRAADGEVLRTLDGKERKLDSQMLVIADSSDACALAGIMGGEASEVTVDTKDIFFECAYFDPKRVRYTARALGLDTDASFRFQRGTDPAGLPRALERVVELTLTIAGGNAELPAVDVQPRPVSRRAVDLRSKRVAQLLGTDLDDGVIQDSLEAIGFQVNSASPGVFTVDVPSWRPDVEREVDLIEEVARRYGYDKFPDQIRTFRPTALGEDVYVRLFDRLRDFFVGAGFLEAKTNPFAPADAGEVRLMNPLSEREDHLRSDLLTQLVHRVEYNFARRHRDVRLFEIGTAFASSDGAAPLERIRVAAVWTGRRTPDHWTESAASDWDAWDLKWIMTSVGELAAQGAEVRPLDADNEAEIRLEDPLVAVTSDGQLLGWAGRLPADRVEAPAWAGAVWGLEIDIIAGAAQPTVYEPLPIYPAVERDIALLVPREVLAAEVERVIHDAGPDYLEEVAVFDVYEGANIPEDNRSIAWRLRFRSRDGTLTDDIVDGAMAGISSSLQERLNVRIRGS